VIEIVRATMDHAADLAPRLRALDLAEIEAASGRPVSEVLAESLDRALWSEAVLVEGRVEALGGLGTFSMMFGPGVPWLVGSDRLTERARWFLGESRRQVRRMLGQYQRLENRVDARNAPAIRYLRWLGFTLEPARPWGHAGLPFHPFTMERH
jgi:hypothetical protein